MIDHSILHPTFDDDKLIKECRVALEFDVASVCVKPYAVKDAAALLKGSDVKAAGDVRDLDYFLEVMDAGATRVGATATVKILEEAQKRFG